MTNEPQRDALLEVAVGKQLIAPLSLGWEIGNAFSAMFKRRRIEIEAAIVSIRLFRDLPIEMRSVELEAAVRLAHHLSIYAYDAYMLQCAMENQAELLTLDRGLKAAARLVGVTVCELKP